MLSNVNKFINILLTLIQWNLPKSLFSFSTSGHLSILIIRQTTQYSADYSRISEATNLNLAMQLMTKRVKNIHEDAIQPQI